MAEFSKLYLTKRGQALMAKILAGASKIEFTKVSTSSKIYAESALENLTALDNVQQSNNVTKVTVTNGTSVKVETAFTNAALGTGYYLRSLGLYAKDPNLGEILYAVCVETSGYCYMPAYNGVTVSSAYIQLYTTVGNSDNVSLAVYSGAYATIEDIEELQKEISDLQAFVGFTDSNIYGVEVDFKNRKFTRLAGAFGKAGGSPFYDVHAFGGRRRCNVTNEGKVIAYYGDSGFSTTGATTELIEIKSGPNAGTYPVGTPVQVMVEQPKFYYRVVPMTTEIVSEGANAGHHLRKARYYVCDTPVTGFKVHPAFVRNGKENDYIYLAAFKGSLYDVSASAYIRDDAQVADFNNDLLSSIANAKPISGQTQNLTRANTRKLAHNRGAGWEQMYAATAAASQLLMLVEYATFNMQSAIGSGHVNTANDGSTNMAGATGATVLLGNSSGTATTTGNIQMVSYRGEENLWGDIWSWIDGMNEQNPDTIESGDHGILYVTDHGFKDNTGEAPYEDTGLHSVCATGYVNAFGYSEAYDYLFIATEIGGNSALPVSDYIWNANPGWRVGKLGGYWAGGSAAGAFALNLIDVASDRYRYVGGRLVYVPSGASEAAS